MKNLFLLYLIFIVSCSEPKIDGSTDENLKTSIDQIKKSLGSSESEKFDQALIYISMQNIDLSNMFQSNLDPDEYAQNFLNQVKDEIDGKTAFEIISKGDFLRLELEQKQMQQVLLEIKKLEEKKLQADLARKELSKFEVVNSQYYRQESSFYPSRIKLSIQNNTEFAISRAYFRGTYATPGRQIPWLVEEFSKSIPGGIEPSEELTMEIIPIDRSWDNLEVKNDAVLTIEVIRIDGPESTELFSSLGLSDFEKARLKQLKQKYN